MQIALETLGLPPERFTTDDRLVEIDAGEWSGRCVEDAKANDPRWASRMADRWNIPCPGGESNAAMAERARLWMESVGRETVVISHGGFGRVLRGIYAGRRRRKFLRWMSRMDAFSGCTAGQWRGSRFDGPGPVP
jgi:probable phosphoglycerate mutase